MNNESNNNSNTNTQAEIKITYVPWYKNWKTYAYVGAAIAVVGGAAYLLSRGNTAAAEAAADAAADAIASAATTTAEAAVEAVA